jgi:serine protease Do
MGSSRVVAASSAGAWAFAVVSGLLTVGCDRLISRQAATDGAPRPPAPSGSGGAPVTASPGPGVAVTPKTETPSEARVISNAFANAATALRPSVVRIEVEIASAAVASRGPGRQGSPEDVAPFLRRFFDFGDGEGPGPAQGPQRGTGSGVVLDGAGNIVTNRHVVNGATTVRVIFQDGRGFSAKLIGTDSETDVAVIRLNDPPKDLVAARLGDSDAVEVGEWVLAVGSPLGLDQTVTAGIVSGKGRVGRHVQMSGERVRQYIQTDAKINPGNSGGPLVNLSAEVVGINTLINAGPGGAYGFAIPINQVRMVAQGLMKEGRVRYPYLGVLVGELSDLEPEQRARANINPQQSGAFVRQTLPGGPAEKAGLHPGDVLLALNGKKIQNAADVVDYVATQTIGTHVHAEYLRNGKPDKADIALGELQSEEARKAQSAASAELGMSLQTLTPTLAESMGLEPATRGVAITDVASGGGAESAGLQAGDVIIEVDRKPVVTAEAATEALAAARAGGHLLRVRGAEGIRFVTLPRG